MGGGESMKLTLRWEEWVQLAIVYNPKPPILSRKSCNGSLIEFYAEKRLVPG